MKWQRGTPVLALVLVSFAMLATFQNCGPAKLNSSGEFSSPQTVQPSTVGNRVDLASIVNAPVESSANVLYPPPATARQSYYSVGTYICENIVLKSDNFDRIEWVHMNSSIVLANGEVFAPKLYTAALAGVVLIVGYRGTTAYQLGQVVLAPKGSSVLNANSVGAVQVSQKTIATDAADESILIDVDAPAVDIKSIQFVNQNTGLATTGQRAVLISKKRSVATTLLVSVSDLNGQTFQKTLVLPATLAVAPAATPAPPPAQSDLVLTAISWAPAVVNPGTAVKFSAVVKNIGAAATPAGVVLRVKFSVNGQDVSWSDMTTSLQPGASITVVANGGPTGSSDWVPSAAGNFSVTASADDLNRIAESNETNNTLSAAGTVDAVEVWTQCAVEGASCAFTGARTVRYGGNGVYAYMQAAGSIFCGNSVFGDPAYGFVKLCEVSSIEPTMRIRSRINGASFIDAYSSAGGIPMQLWSATLTASQNFTFTANSELKVQGKCMVASSTSGTALSIVGCNGANNQKWTYDPSSGELKSNAGMCADVPNSVVTNATKVNIFTCNSGVNQQWDFVQ